MNVSRRALLRAGGVALAGGLAGCGCCPPMEFTRVETAVERSFDTEGSSYEVPLAVEVVLQRPGSETVGVGGVGLHALDTDREPAATAWLGDFTYRNADPERRREEAYDGGDACGSTTVYRATHGRELVLKMPAFPELIAVGVQRVWFDGEDTPEETGTAADWEGPVGVVGATSCASRPDLTVTALRYAGERPPPAVVEPSAYERDSVTFPRYHEFDAEPLVPRWWTPTPSPTSANGTARNGTARNATAPNGTTHDTPGNRTGTAGSATTTGTATPYGN